MGLKYNKNDGQLFISAMNHNVSSANEIVSRLKDGSDHLISMVNGGSAQLSGKAYNAVGTLFTSLVQPVLSKLESATEDIKNDIQVFQSQSSAFNAFNDTIYDEEKLNHLKEIKQQQQATVVTQIGMFNNTLLGDLAKNVAEALFYEGKRLENVSEHYANEMKEIDDKLRILHEFSSSTSHLFQDSLTVFQSAMQGVKALNQGRFDSNGNFSMPAGSDMSWYKTLTNQKLDSALVSDDEAEREELLKALDVNGLTGKDRDKYESSVSDILKTLQKQGWTKAGLEAYLKTLATINSNSHSAGDVFPVDSLIENAQLMKFLLDNASHLDVSKYVEKGWEWEKTNTYYFINGEPNFVLTQLGAYLPNFNVTKKASPEEMASVSKVQENVVVNPEEEGLALLAGVTKTFDIEEIRPLLKTNPNTAFFWSGRTEGIGGAETAATIAEGKGGVTLESTIGTKKIEMPEWDFGNPDSMKAWDLASGAYAEQVSGEIRAVVGSELRAGNIWENIELPRLMKNPEVSKITIIDPKTGFEKVIFERK